MSRNQPSTWIRLLACILLGALSACNAAVTPAAPSPTPSESVKIVIVPSVTNAPQSTATLVATATPMLIATEVQQTVIALQASQTALVPNAVQASSTPPAPGTTLQASATPPAAPVTGPTLATTQRVIFDKAELVSMGKANNMTISVGDGFEMSWTFKNTGHTTWSRKYHLVWYGGDRLNGSYSTALPGNIEPGKEVKLTVGMNAPSTLGTRHSYWALANSHGDLFSIVSVTIIVK